MVSASLRKSVTDLSRRKARTAFTVATLALAVASIAFFAVPTLIDRAMQDEVAASALADATVSMRPVPLGDAELDGLAALPNVEAVEPANGVDVRVLVGERRAAARVIGVRDFERQSVDLVRLESGARPGPGEVLVEVQDANVGVYDGGAGDTLTVVGSGGEEAAQLEVTGSARNIPGGEQVQDENVIVLYASAETVEELSGAPGYGRLAFLLEDASPAAAAATVEDVREYMGGVEGFTGFSNLPAVRAPGDWPGKAETNDFASLLAVITLLALLSALVLVSNTMTTLIAEQTGEIGVMRAIGARRRQVAFVYLRTALLLGALGAVLGVALGVVISSLLAGYFGKMFWAIDVGFGVDPVVVAASLVVGLVAPPLAALPAIRRAVRTDLREALEATGSPLGGEGAIDRGLRRAGFLPRTAQIGLRNVGRRKRRSFATAAIVALAAGNLLATMGLAASVTETTQAEWGDHLEDVRIWTAGRETFDARAEEAIRSVDGVAEVQPALVNEVTLDGEEAFVWGVPHEPLFRYRISEGRWFGAEEDRAAEPVAVIERSIAEATGVSVGSVVPLDTAAGPVELRIVGVAENQQENGTVLFVPLTTVRELLDVPAGASTYWIKADSSDEAFVDRTTTAVEDELAALGYGVGTEITYVATAENVAANRTITTTIAVLGFLIVLMSLVGLANAVTTNVLERTREIGVLRCIGARARDVRRIFATEGVALALLGWAMGVPLGYVLNRALVWMVQEVVNVEFAVRFPAQNLAIALVGTVVLALLVLALPLRRAVRLRPGDALRYG
ncbi:MAG TPA: FtsX-like permease family protein [Gaiellaceae bacterium]|nr:FtsX-like permease family protein [Gaiellaceae bacterium]